MTKMKSVALLGSVMILTAISAGRATEEHEVTLFDRDGVAQAYIAKDEDFTIYLWNGEPVAYLKIERGEGVLIYGFNGKQLGWYEKGIVRNRKGYVVGFVEGTIGNVQTKIEPIKGLKKLMPLKSLEELSKLRPLNQGRFSKVPLNVFLALGSKKDICEILDE